MNTNSIIYIELEKKEITTDIFSHFNRHQKVDMVWRKSSDGWKQVSEPFIDQWNEKDYEVLVRYLQNTVQTKGVVLGAWTDTGLLKGFASVEANSVGEQNEYVQLSSLHVSEDCRNRGIGKRLFSKVVEAASRMGAIKLYISSHSAVETQGFYRGLGCVDAKWVHTELVKKEPYDCQLEYEI